MWHITCYFCKKQNNFVFLYPTNTSKMNFEHFMNLLIPTNRRKRKLDLESCCSLMEAFPTLREHDRIDSSFPHWKLPNPHQWFPSLKKKRCTLGIWGEFCNVHNIRYKKHGQFLPYFRYTVSCLLILQSKSRHAIVTQVLNILEKLFSFTHRFHLCTTTH